MIICNGLCVLRTVNTKEGRLFKVAKKWAKSEVWMKLSKEENICLLRIHASFLLPVSAQTIYEIVWQVHGDATAGSEETRWWEGVEGTGYTQPWWKWSELQGLPFICSIAREILRDVCLSFTFIDSLSRGWEEPTDTSVEGAER